MANKILLPNQEKNKNPNQKHEHPQNRLLSWISSLVILTTVVVTLLGSLLYVTIPVSAATVIGAKVPSCVQNSVSSCDFTAGDIKCISDTTCIKNDGTIYGQCTTALIPNDVYWKVTCGTTTQGKVLVSTDCDEQSKTLNFLIATGGECTQGGTIYNQCQQFSSESLLNAFNQQSTLKFVCNKGQSANVTGNAFKKADCNTTTDTITCANKATNQVGSDCTYAKNSLTVIYCNNVKTATATSAKVPPAEACTFDAVTKTCLTNDKSKQYYECELNATTGVKICAKDPRVAAGADATCDASGNCKTKDGKTLQGCANGFCSSTTTTNAALDPKKDDGACGNIAANIICWLANIVIVILTIIIWLLVQVAKFVLGLMAGIFVVLVSVNPASNELLNVAYAPWQSVVNIANIVLVAGIIFMGFGYILNLEFIKKSKGLQDFFLGLLAVGVMMNFTFSVTAAVVNVSNGVGNIIYFGAGGIASTSLETSPNISQELKDCLIKSREASGGDSGIAFTNVFICNVSQISRLTSLAESGDTGKLLAEVVTSVGGDAPSNFITTAIALAIFVLAIFSFGKVLFVLLVRIFGLWILIVVSPLALVAYFSPLPMIKKFGTDWVDYFLKLCIAYPFYTFGITLVTLMIGNVSSALTVSAKKVGISAVLDSGSGTVGTYAQGVQGLGKGAGGLIGGVGKGLFSTETITALIVALFAFGLVYLFGDMFWKIFAVFWQAAKSAAGAVWKYGGKQLTGVVNAGARAALGSGVAQKLMTKGSEGLNKMSGGIAEKIANQAGKLVNVGNSMAGSQANGVSRWVGTKISNAARSFQTKRLADAERLRARAGDTAGLAKSAREFADNFTIQGAVLSNWDRAKATFAGYGKQDEARIKFDREKAMIDRAERLSKTPEGRKQLAAEGNNMYASANPQADNYLDQLKTIREEEIEKIRPFKTYAAGKKTSDRRNAVTYDTESILGGKDGVARLLMEDGMIDNFDQYTKADPETRQKFLNEYLNKNPDTVKEMEKLMTPEQKARLLKTLSDALAGSGGAGSDLMQNAFLSGLMSAEENLEKFSEEARKTFVGGKESAGENIYKANEKIIRQEIANAGEKWWKTVSDETLRDTNFRRIAEEELGRGGLEQKVGLERLRQAGIAPEKVISNSMMRTSQEAIDILPDGNVLKENKAMARALIANSSDRLDNSLNDHYKEFLKGPETDADGNRLIDIDPNTGRKALTDEGVKQMYTQSLDKLFGGATVDATTGAVEVTDLADVNELNDFLDTAELGKALQADQSFRSLPTDKKLEYANELRKVQAKTYHENRTQVTQNIKEAAKIIGVKQDLEGQTTGAQKNYEEGVLAAVTGLNASKNDELKQQALELAQKGKLDDAMDVKYMDQVLTDPTLTSNVAVQEYARLAKEHKDATTKEEKQRAMKALQDKYSEIRKVDISAPALAQTQADITTVNNNISATQAAKTSHEATKQANIAQLRTEVATIGVDASQIDKIVNEVIETGSSATLDSHTLFTPPTDVQSATIKAAMQNIQSANQQVKASDDQLSQHTARQQALQQKESAETVKQQFEAKKQADTAALEEIKKMDAELAASKIKKSLENAGEMVIQRQTGVDPTTQAPIYAPNPVKIEKGKIQGVSHDEFTLDIKELFAAGDPISAEAVKKRILGEDLPNGTRKEGRLGAKGASKTAQRDYGAILDSLIDGYFNGNGISLGVAGDTPIEINEGARAKMRAGAVKGAVAGANNIVDAGPALKAKAVEARRANEELVNGATKKSVASAHLGGRFEV